MAKIQGYNESVSIPASLEAVKCGHAVDPRGASSGRKVNPGTVASVSRRKSEGAVQAGKVSRKKGTGNSGY